MNIKQLYDLNINPQYFGLGFIQLKINDSERYHFYNPNLLPIVNIEEEVHNHRYNFSSEVIGGEIINKIYHFEAQENGNFIKENETCNAGIKLTENEKNKQIGFLKLDLVDIVHAGKKYDMSYNVFHTIETKYCITKLTRSDYLQPYAQVIRPINSMVTCPFSKPLSTQDCWTIIKETLDYII